VGGFGQYGTNYPLRAVISQIGLGAFTSGETIFALTWADHNKTPLAGSKNSVLHMAFPPPVNEGWSLTVYNLKGAMIQNPINRYASSDSSHLSHNADGSMDFYLQSTQPSDPVKVNNWLPTANGQGLEVIWRLMAPKPSEILGIVNGTGWQFPSITPMP